MHRAYQPVTPTNNIFLKQRWDQEVFKAHRKKVLAAKSVIDNYPPKTHMHLHIKLKKLQHEAERLATIERDNRILLEKMAYIMRTASSVDHRKHDYASKTLNKSKRQRELLRITHENLAILKRITTKAPHYNHKQWLVEWQMNQQYLMNVSKYPHPWRAEQHAYITQLQRQQRANKKVTVKNKQSSKAESEPDQDIVQGQNQDT